MRKSLYRSLVRIHPIDHLAVGLQITHEDGPARLDGEGIRRHEARSLISQFGNVACAHDLPDLSFPQEIDRERRRRPTAVTPAAHDLREGGSRACTTYGVVGGLGHTLKKRPGGTG